MYSIWKEARNKQLSLMQVLYAINLECYKRADGIYWKDEVDNGEVLKRVKEKNGK